MEPPVKKARKTHVSSPEKATRFPAPTGSPTMSNICKGYIPQNTDKATTWALRVFNAWHQERNRVTTEKCPDDLLESPDVGNLNCWLSSFVVECRRQDGKPHPPSSISNILAGSAVRGVYVLVMLVPPCLNCCSSKDRYTI